MILSTIRRAFLWWRLARVLRQARAERERAAASTTRVSTPPPITSGALRQSVGPTVGTVKRPVLRVVK